MLFSMDKKKTKNKKTSANHLHDAAPRCQFTTFLTFLHSADTDRGKENWDKKRNIRSVGGWGKWWNKWAGLCKPLLRPRAPVTHKHIPKKTSHYPIWRYLVMTKGKPASHPSSRYDVLSSVLMQRFHTGQQVSRLYLGTHPTDKLLLWVVHSSRLLFLCVPCATGGSFI